MKITKVFLSQLVLTIISMCLFSVYYNSDFYINKELSKKLIFDTQSISNVNLTDVDNEKVVSYKGSDITIELESSFDSYSLRDTLLSSGETNIDKILRTIRNNAKVYYRDLRETFSEKYQLDIETEISSPFISIYSQDNINNIDMLSNEIKEVLMDDNVLNATISLRYIVGLPGDGGGGVAPRENDPPSGFLGRKEILDKVNATNSGYNGLGVNIGILEAYDENLGQPNTSYLTTVKVYKRLTSSETSKHATAVTKCASWLAPSAKYYCSSIINNASADDMEPIQWMLDNNVSVINMSFGLHSRFPITYKNAVARFYDKLVYDNFVTLVVAAGNEFTTLSSPGICNNVISVGATNTACTDRAEFSSYVAPYSISKPNIMAPGENIFFDMPRYYDSDSGTSFAAPIVTGAVAQLIQKDSTLKLFPEAVQAILYNTASQTLVGHGKYAGFDVQNGSGMLNVKNALDNIYNNYTWNIVTNENFRKHLTITRVYVSSGQTLNINLNWLMQFSGTTRNISDLELYIHDSTGNRVALSNSSENNSELVRYNVSSTGYYTIYMYQHGDKLNYKEYCSVAWSIS